MLDYDYDYVELKKKEFRKKHFKIIMTLAGRSDNLRIMAHQS